MAAAFYYDLDLFSDFTYYLVDYGKEDQFNQQDRRWVGYVDAHHTTFSTWFGRKMSNTYGVQFRNDWINNGLYRTVNRVRTTKTDYSATGASFFPVGSTAGPNCIDLAPNTPLTLTVILPTGTINGSAAGTAAGTTASFSVPTGSTFDTATCPTLPASTSRDNFTDMIGSAFVENKIQWASRFRSVLALRGDEEKFVVTSLAYPNLTNLSDGTTAIPNALNSGSAVKFLPSPKASLIFGPRASTEFYLQGGFSFHSNDGRGSTQKVEPVSPDYPYPGQIQPKISPLVEQKGGEIGARTTAIPHLQSTFELWYLHSNSELTQDGDTGGTLPSEQSSNRYGLEWANYYTPTEHLAFDADIADSRAQFTLVDPFDASYQVVNAPLYVCTTGAASCPTVSGNYDGNVYWQQAGPGGKLVPEAVKVVVSSGATLHDYKGFTSSLRLRYFGPRNLTSDGLYQSNQTVLLNGEIGYKLFKKWRVMAELLNMLDRKDADIDYAYVYQITPNAVATPPAFGRVTHPTEPFLARFSLGRSF
jgi:hypothetical protein